MKGSVWASLNFILSKGEDSYIKSTVLDNRTQFNRREIGQALHEISDGNYGVELSKWSSSEPHTYYVESINREEMRVILRDNHRPDSKGDTPS